MSSLSMHCAKRHYHITINYLRPLNGVSLLLYGNVAFSDARSAYLTLIRYHYQRTTTSLCSQHCATPRVAIVLAKVRPRTLRNSGSCLSPKGEYRGCRVRRRGVGRESPNVVSHSLSLPTRALREAPRRNELPIIDFRLKRSALKGSR